MHLYVYLCLTFAYASAQVPAGSGPFTIDYKYFNKKVFAVMADEVNDIKAQAGVLTPLFDACKVTINSTIDSCKVCVDSKCASESAASGANILNVLGQVYYATSGSYLTGPLAAAGQTITDFAIKYGAEVAQSIVSGFNWAGQGIANFFKGDVLNGLKTAVNGITFVGEQIEKHTTVAGKHIGNAFEDVGDWFSGWGKRRRRSIFMFADAHEISRQKRATEPTQAVKDCYNNNCHVCKPFLLEVDAMVASPPVCPDAAAKNASYVASVTKFQNIFQFFNETSAPSNELIKDVYMNYATLEIVQATGWFPNAPGAYQVYTPVNVVMSGFDFLGANDLLAAEYHGRVHALV